MIVINAPPPLMAWNHPMQCIEGRMPLSGTGSFFHVVSASSASPSGHFPVQPVTGSRRHVARNGSDLTLPSFAISSR